MCRECDEETKRVAYRKKENEWEGGIVSGEGGSCSRAVFPLYVQTGRGLPFATPANYVDEAQQESRQSLTEKQTERQRERRRRQRRSASLSSNADQTLLVSRYCTTVRDCALLLLLLLLLFLFLFTPQTAPVCLNLPPSSTCPLGFAFQHHFYLLDTNCLRYSYCSL